MREHRLEGRGGEVEIITKAVKKEISVESVSMLDSFVNACGVIVVVVVLLFAC